MKNNIERAIEELQSFYAEVGKDKSLEYTFGFFDALQLLAAMAKNS